MTKFDKRNRRCRKLINKKYRRYGDIWGRLAIKKRNNFITNLVYKYESNAFHERKKKQPRKHKKMLKKQFTQKKKHYFFGFEINVKEKRVFKKRYSKGGSLLKMRRQLSLYYGGGRIRRKTFRRYGRMSSDSKITYLNTLGAYTTSPYKTFGSIIESRLDVLLLRANFVDSIYTSRALINHHKTFVQGHKIRPNPGNLIPNFQIFGLRGRYTRSLRNILYTRIKKKGILSIPSYLHINFCLLIAFKIEEPNLMKVSFPFADQAGAAATFRKSFALL